MSKDIGKRLAEQKKTPKKKGRLSWQQIVLIAVIVLLALALAAVLAVRSLFVRPEIPVRNNTPAASTGPDADNAPEEIDWGDGIRPRGGDGERKSEDYWTVLILGRDTGGGGNMDTMLLASYDVTNQKATVLSIPRDTMVNIPYDIKRINAVYNYYGQGEKGTQALYKEISQLVGFEPDYQVIVEWEAVGKIVDAMGGVYFDVPRNMNYDDPYQDLHIHQEKGYRLLSGDDAMQVLRYRYDTGKKRGYAEGDIGRIKTQQAFLTAMVEQLLQAKNITRIREFAKVFQECVETDLTFQNCFWFAKAAYMGGLKMENVHFVTAPGNYAATCWSRTYKNMQSYVTLYPNELLKLVNEELSPFKEVFTLSDLDIMTVNADGSVRSSTGYVEDKKAAQPPVRPKPQEEEPVEEPVVDENGNPVVIDPETGLPVPADPNPNESGGSSPESPNGGSVNNHTPNSDINNGTPGITPSPDTGSGDGTALPPTNTGENPSPSDTADPGISTAPPNPDNIGDSTSPAAPTPAEPPSTQPETPPAPAEPNPGFTFIPPEEIT